MNRRIIEDIKINKKKASLKPSPIINNRIKEDKIETEITSDYSNINFNSNSKRIFRDPHLPGEKKKSNKFIFILFFLIVLTGIIFWGSLLFESVNVVITKKHQIFNLDHQTLTALKDLKSSIPFEIIIVSEKKAQDVNLSQSEEVSLKAKGDIVLYNEYSKNAEKLSVNTYLSDENGKVYLTDKTISIPGYTIKDKKIIPGQVVVSATSFLPGESYNGSPIDFHVNAFKGTSKYEKIYGKAKTIFSGGALGLNYSLNEQDEEKLKKIVNSFFKESLLNKVNSLIPKEYIFYPEASSFTYEIEKNFLSPTPNSRINISGTLSAVLLLEDNLKKTIIKKTLPEISDKELNTIEITGVNNLVFNFTDDNQIITKELESAHFSLTGELDFIWTPDLVNLKNKLLGVAKDNLTAIFEQDIGIGNASVKIFPPWKKILPIDPSRIHITVF